MKKIYCIGVFFLFCLGCDSLRFAPTEKQKQNAWLHSRTSLLAAQSARQQDCSQELKSLTELCELQSQAFSSYFGLPKEFPAAQTAEQVLAGANYELAKVAISEAEQRPDPFDLAGSLLELGIGISALFGGVYGVKAVEFLKIARAKSQALREIVQGNEIFKSQSESYSEDFKKAHQTQSAQTRKIVTEIKNG